MLELNNELSTTKADYRNLEKKLTEQKQELEEIQNRFKMEFENLAGKILDDKSRKFTEQNKENLDNILTPLKERIADFEKIRIIKELASRSTDKAIKDLWQQLEQHLQVFISEKDFNEEKITADVIKGNELLDQLSDRLSGKLSNKRIL